MANLSEGDARQRAAKVLAGGVSNGWNILPGGPRYFRDAHGPYLIDLDGNQHLDFQLGWGALLLGHNPPALRAALSSVLQEGGFLLQVETERHIQLAERLCERIPCAERVRLANSGTEATMFAVRLARARTGRHRIVKFEGHFHGLHENLLFGTDGAPRLGLRRGDGSLESIAASAGIPPAFSEACLTLPFNDTDAFARCLQARAHEIAAVILEPICFNLGVIPASATFLSAVRALTAQHGIALIFDEVLTGFRVAPGTAQARLGVTPDLTCLGKALGCGMPIAAVVGRQAWMDGLTPVGNVEMSGTSTGRILNVAGALAALEATAAPGFHAHLEHLQRRLIHGLRELLARHGVPAVVNGCGGRIGLYLGLDRLPSSLPEIAAQWDEAFHLRCQADLQARGLYGFLSALPFHPEAITLCAAHTDADIDTALDRFDDVLRRNPYTRARHTQYAVGA